MVWTHSKWPLAAGNEDARCLSRRFFGFYAIVAIVLLVFPSMEPLRSQEQLNLQTSPPFPSLTSSMQWCPLHCGIVHQGAGPAVKEDGNNVPVREKVEECGREEGVTVTEGLSVHTTSLSISSYWQLISEAGINYHHAPTRSEHILQLTCDLGRQPSPMVFGPLGPCDQSGSGSGTEARPQPQCGHCRPRRREGDSPQHPLLPLMHKSNLSTLTARWRGVVRGESRLPDPYSSGSRSMSC